MSGPLQLTRASDGVRVLTICREKRRNALDNETIAELMSQLDDAAQDQTARVIVITGAGKVAFCAGSDVKALQDMSHEERVRHTVLGQGLMDAIVAHPCVVIAAVEGFAVGGGFELALACDLIVASTDAIFGFPEVARGMLPAWGGTYRLSRSVGLLPAKTSILGGRRWTADDADRLGLLLEVTPPGEAGDRASEIAQGLAAVSDREAFAIAKSLLNASGHNADPDGQLRETLGEAIRAARPDYGA